MIFNGEKNTASGDHPTSLFANNFLLFLHPLVTYCSSLPDEVKMLFQIVLILTSLTDKLWHFHKLPNSPHPLVSASPATQTPTVVSLPVP